MAIQAVPPSPKWWVSGPNRRVYPPPQVATRQNDLQGTRHDPPPVTWLVGRGGGKKSHFFKYSLIKGYFKRPIWQNLSAKLAPTLLQCQSLPTSFLWAVRRENAAYTVTRACIRPSKMACLSQSATLLSTGNISAEGSEHQEQSRPQQQTWNSKKSSLLFSRWKVLLHTVYIFNIFMWTEVIDSRLQ